jgi:beta-mannanase
VRWSAVAAGDFDDTLTNAAKGLAALHKPFFITFDHEADNKAKLAARGTPAQFVAAWRHVREVFRKAGATQAIWTWVVTGFAPNYPTVLKLYPGNDAVDWISWDPYDSRGCQNGDVGSDPAQTFAEIARPFYDWLATTGAKAGISLKKPYMISETGSAYDPKDPQATVAFFTSIPAGLRELPRIRAVTLWNQTAGDCNFMVNGVKQLQPALRSTASQLSHLAK